MFIKYHNELTPARPRVVGIGVATRAAWGTPLLTAQKRGEIGKGDEG